MHESEEVIADTYAEILKMAAETPGVVMMMLFLSLISMGICALICYFMAKSAGLSKKYTFWGILGVTGIMVVLCAIMAKSGNMPKAFMFLGFLGIYGIIIMVILMAVFSKIGNKQDSSTMYHGERDGYQSEWQRQYDQMRNNDNQHNNEGDNDEGYNLNGVYHESEKGKICLNCGAAVAAGVKICPRCKEPL